jgi:multidrug efflux pump subunit AcrB
MWIVRLALRRPYTFIVMSLLIGVLGTLATVRMPVDIFPVIDIPVVNVIWSYAGISADEMAQRITTSFERGLTTTVNDIEHIESQSIQGACVIRVYFHPGAKVEMAIAQISALSGGILRIMPPGITPPAILKYNAASVPILQLGLSSRTLSEQQLYDLSQNFIRTQLATVQGASLPTPYGGRARQIMVDLDPRAMLAHGVSATDLSNAMNAQNLILPAGSAKIAEREYNIRLNSSPEAVEEFGDLPVKVSSGALIRFKDVANVRDGYAVQSNIVRHDGSRGALLTVLKSGQASTLEIIARVKTQLAQILAGLPPELKVERLFDQSVFVRDAISNVLHEAGIAAVLTALMILLFLGSWRSTVMVCISIPLSILASLSALYLTGETINTMTLGGLALAVGVLVDDATVELENIHRNLGQRKPILQAILDGAQQIAVPTFVSTFAICIVFVTVIFLTGTARYLFTPLAMAVVFAMAASYLLSRTLVPTMARYLLPAEAENYRMIEEGVDTAGGPVWRMHLAFHHQFEKLRNHYAQWLAWALAHRKTVTGGFLAFTAASTLLFPFIGQDFFPDVDAGLMRLHVRAPSGTRVEETERIFAQVEDTIRKEIPASELETILDNIGLPTFSFNLAFSDSATISAADGEILVALKKERLHRTMEYVTRLRQRLAREHPGLVFFFQPADMTNQILNFGLPAPVDIQISSRQEAKAYEIAQEIERRVKRIPGAVDVHLHQVIDAPEIRVNVQREKAQQIGYTQRDIASSLLISLSSTTQISPGFWLNPRNGVSYLVALQTPQAVLTSLADLARTPLTSSLGAPPQTLSNVARFERSQSATNVSHYNVQPVFDVYANVNDRDLGGLAADIRALLEEFRAKLPPGMTLEMRGQAETMRASFARLGFGLLFAILLVYLLMVVNFQSWLDPFIILTALPGLFTGILWMLFATQTSISVPSLMGSIMSIGVATANSILLVTFANDQRSAGQDATQAALSAGFIRLRPVVMTALAMIIGMLPISLGLGEGGEQNAPLGRAVIGGLVMATGATLFFVPVMYSILRRKPPLHLEIPETRDTHHG